MGGKGTQVVLLTATLPPSDESRFFDAIGLERRATTVVRESTRRTNLAYRVLEYERGKLEDALQNLRRGKMAADEEGKMVIYCKSIAETKRMAKALGCKAYYREVGTEEEKRQVQAELVRRGGARVFTATNALGLGIDAPSIRTVVHTGIPFDLRQYGQESGRAGRDGGRSEAIMLRWVKNGRNGGVIVEKNTRAGEEVRTFVRGERCRKVVMEEFMDGKARAVRCRVGEGEVGCDVCERAGEGVDGEEGGRSGGEEQGRKLTTVMSREEEEAERVVSDTGRRKRKLGLIEAEEERLGKRAREEVGDRWESTEKLRKKLVKYAERCAIWVTKGEEGNREHEWWECGAASEEEMWKMEQGWEELGSIDWESYSSCWGCKTPQAVCNGWGDVGNRERGVYEKRDGVECQFRGVLRAGLAAVLTVREEEAREWLEGVVVSNARARGEEGEQGRFGWWEMVKKWLGRRVDMGGGWQGSGASLLFSKVASGE